MLRFAVLGLCLVLANIGAAAAAESCSPACEAVTTGTSEAEVARLEARVAALEARIAELETKSAGAAVPDDEAMERVMLLTERMMRRFFSMVREMKGDAQGEEL